jgi:hypothetical protein
MMTPTRSVAIPTTAGRQVQFRQGMAVINDTRDLPYLLSRSDVRLEVSEYAMSWMDEVLGQVQIIKANVRWPDGYEVVHRNTDDFDILAPAPAMSFDVVAPPDPEVVTPDPLDAAIKGKPRWQKPPSNSSES